MRLRTPYNRPQKNIETPPHCVNCLQNHTANCKGCIVYRQILKSKLQNNNSYRKDKTNQYVFNSEDYPNQFKQNANTNTSQNSRFSYSEILRNQQQLNALNKSFEKLEKLIQKQIKQTNKLINMMSLLISKLCN